MSGGRLIVLDRAGRDAKQYALTEGLATLGSDLACDIRLMLPAVSPHHATVMVQANQTVVQSVSEGVTLLNDVPVSVAVLRHGDIISMGGRALRWEYSQPQHRPHSKPQPPLVAINKTRNRGKGHRSRSSDPVLHDTPAHNQRASLPASSMKQVAIVQPQRRNVMQGEPSCTTELTDSSQIENTENENTQETITRKSARPSQKSLQTITKASEWIESRKSSRAPITPTRTRNNLTPSDIQSRTKSATRPMTQRDTQLRSKSLACIPLETKGEKTKVTLTPRQTQSRSKILDGTQIEIKITRASLTPKETREVLSKSAVTAIDTNAEPKSGTRKSLTPRDALLEPVEVGSKQTKTSIRTTPRQTQSSPKVEVTPLQSRTPAKSTVRSFTPRETRKSRISTLGSATNSVQSRNALILKAARDSRKSSLTPTLSKSRTQAITPTENREPGSNIHTDRRTPLNQSKSLLARSAQSTSTSVLSRSRLTSTPTSSNRQAQFPEKRVLPPRARTLTPRAQEFATNKSLTMRTSRDTSLRLTVLRKSHRPVKIQAPTLIDHTKQAALLLMTRHTKSKSPNAVSTVVVKPSPMSKSLKRNSRGLRESLVRKRKSSVLNTSDELSTRRSLSCPSARKSSMKSTLKDPMSGRKTESIKFDLSNLEHDTKSDRLISSVVTVDTTNQTFDSISSHGSPSLRRSIHSRSSRIIEKTLGSPMTVTETTETSIATSPKSRSSRGSLIVQKALEETLKTQNDTSAQTNLTKTLSPRAETYSIVDLVSHDSNATEYNTIDSTPFGTPRSHRETRSFAVALPSSTPYKVPINRSLQYENGNDTPPHADSPEVITPQNDENNKPVASTKVSKRSRSKSRLNDSDLFLLEDEDSPRTSKRADKSATNSLDVSHLKRKLSQSLTESDEESDKSDKNVFAKVPKNSLSNVRIKELFAKSPQNDLRRVSGVKTLFKSLRKQNTPKNTLEDVKGVKRLFKEKEKTPKNTLEDVSGVKGLFRRSPRNDLRVSGVKDALRIKSPKNDLTDVRGVRRLYRLEKERYSSNVSGIEEMFKETSDMDTTFDLLMNKPPLRTYKAASAQKMKQKSKTRLEKSLYDSTSIHVDRWNKNNEIKVYNEKSLPLKKRSIKTLKSTPVKGNVTLNSTELCQISPITKQASVDTAGTSHLDDHTIDISVNNSSVSLAKTTRSTRQNRSALKNSTSTIKQTIVEENPSMSLVIHKKSPIVKSVRKTRQRRMQQQSDSDQNKEIAESKDQKLKETKTKRRTVKTSEPETETISVPRTTRSKATSPRKSGGRRVSIVIKKPTARVTRRGKILVEEQNDKAKKTKAGPNKNEEDAVEGEGRVLTNLPPKIRKRVVIVIPTRTPLASARKTRSRVAAVNRDATKAKNKATKGTIATPSTTRKGKGKEVEPAENQVIEKPKRKQVEKKNPEVVVEVKTRAKATKKLVATEVVKKTQKGKKEVPKAKEIVTPPTGRKKKSPDTTPVESEDIEKPKRGRKKAVKTSVTEVKKQTEVKTRAKANVQAGSSKDNKTAQPKGKKVAPAKEPIAPATSRKRKSPDVTPATKETPVAPKRRKAAELTLPARTTRSKAESKPKIRGQKR